MDVKITPRVELIWRRVNRVITKEKAGPVIAALIGGMTSLIRVAFPQYTELQARAHLAAIVLSPTPGPPGSLLPMVEEELARLRAEGAN